MTRWTVQVPRLDGLVVDSFGIMTLNEQHHRGYGYGGPSWEWCQPDADVEPEIHYLSPSARGVNFLLPSASPIHIVPPDPDPSEISLRTRYLDLYPYRWGNDGTSKVLVLAAYAPEIHTWWIGRITSR